MDKNDKYCKYCGTKKGEGAFLPYNNVMGLVYATPSRKKFICSSCHYNWISDVFGNSANFCPKCGQILTTIVIDTYPYKKKAKRFNIIERLKRLGK